MAEPDEAGTAPETPPETGNDAPETGERQPTAPERLPDDHPAAQALAKANKEAEGLRKRLKEFEDRDKSALEKLSDKIAAAEEHAATAELQKLRLEVAHAKGLTPTQARRLVGTTKEELEADADELLETFATNGTPQRTRRPVGQLHPGGLPEQGEERSPAEIAERIVKRRSGL